MDEPPIWTDDPEMRAKAEVWKIPERLERIERELEDLKGGRKRPIKNGHDADSAWREIELVEFHDIKPHLDQTWLVRGLIQPEQITVAFGPPGCGKTFLCLDIGLHVAAGLEWCGRRTHEGWVIYLAAEAGRSIKNRIAAWKHAHGYDEDQTIPFAAVTSPVDLCHARAGDLDRLIAKIHTVVGEDSVVLIIVDTVSRVLGGGDENSSEDMGALFGAFDRLRDRLRCHVLAIHHCGKDAARGSRGHSLLKGNVDTEIEVTRDDSTRVSTAVVTKQREGEEGEKLSFRLRQVELGRNNDDEPVTSCVLEPTDTPPLARRRPLTGQAGIALQQLRNALIDHGEKPPSNGKYPTGQGAVVRLALWKGYCERGGLAEPGNPDAIRKAFKRASEKLLSDGYIGMWNELVWLVEANAGQRT
jgi:hypothetical protein